MTINVLTISGNLGGDAEVRTTNSGTCITSFSVPAKSGWGDNEKVTWVKCALFGKKGSSEPHGLTPHLVKGRYVTVTGEMELREWEHEGKKYSQVQLVARDVGMGPAPQDATSNQPAKEYQEAAGGAFEDDIPFAPYMNGQVV